MRKSPTHIKRDDVQVGTVLYYQDERNKAWSMEVTRILPKIPGWRGRNWIKYRIQQRSPDGRLSEFWHDESLPYLNRHFKLTA